MVLSHFPIKEDEFVLAKKWAQKGLELNPQDKILIAANKEIEKQESEIE